MFSEPLYLCIVNKVSLMYRKVIILMIISTLCISARAQVLALKNNFLMDAMASPNLGVEFKVGRKATIDIPASFNFWNFSDDKKFKHFAVQPEFRWWVCQPFGGHFFGAHAHYAYYNVGGLSPFRTLKDNRYEGWLVGAGVSYGYNRLLSPRWSLEATIGVGYAYMSHDKYPCGKCRPSVGHRSRHYFGPTRAAVSLIYLLK